LVDKLPKTLSLLWPELKKIDWPNKEREIWTGDMARVSFGRASTKNTAGLPAVGKRQAVFLFKEGGGDATLPDY